MRSDAVLTPKTEKSFAQARPVRICLITTFAANFEFFVSDEAKHFSENGFEVTVVCANMDKQFIEKHEKFAKVYELPMPFGVSFASIPSSVRFLNRFFKENNFDVIQYSSPYASYCCTLSKGLKNIPLRVYTQWLLRYTSCKGLKRSVYKSIEKFTCKGATNVVASTPANMEMTISEGLCPKEKISVIGKGGVAGVDFDVFDIGKKPQLRSQVRAELGIDDDDFVFLNVGRLIADEGVGELISVFRRLCEKNEKLKLIFAGKEDTPSFLDRELISWARQSKNVIFTEEKSDSFTAGLMASADILVLPTHRQRFSIALTEALAMELPVITTDVPGPSEFIVKNESGSIVPRGDEEALFKEMSALMKDENRRRLYAEKGRERAEKFYARTVMRKIWFTYYSRLIGFDDGHIKFMYLTSNPAAAVQAENAGVDRIFLDLEVMGKFERQGHLDTVVSHSSLEDVKILRSVLSKSKLLVRCNPVHQGLGKEIDKIIADGADVIMLPYFKTVEEVKFFLNCVAGRIRTVLLFETAEAVANVDEILELSGIDEVYIGLNDLHLSYKMDFMFELLSNGTVDMLCEKFKAKGISYGFGGIAKIGEGLVKSDDVVGEHVRLGSTCAILSRTFRNEVDASRPIDDLRGEIILLRKREIETRRWSEEDFAENRRRVAEGVEKVLEIKRKKKTQSGE